MKLFYNKQANLPGIYKIINTHSNRIYIGQAGNFKKRWLAHKKSLLTTKKQNRFFMNDFDKCRKELGHDDFIEFHVLEAMPGSSRKERNIKEEFYIKQYYDNQTRCYNFLKKSNALPRRVFSNDPEITKKLLSQKSKAMWANPKIRKKLLERKNEAMKTPEYKKALVEGLKRAWNNEERRKATSGKFKRMHEQPGYTQKIIAKTIANRDENKTRKTKVENKLKILQNRAETVIKKQDWLGPNVSRSKVFEEANIISPNGVLFKKIRNIRAFAKEHGVADSWKLQEVIEMRRWQYKNWFKYFKIEDFEGVEDCFSLFKIGRERALASSRNSVPKVKIYGSLIDPDGKVYENVTNVPTFAKEHGLIKQSLYNLLNGKLKSHKGWKVRKIRGAAITKRKMVAA